MAAALTCLFMATVPVQADPAVEIDKMLSRMPLSAGAAGQKQEIVGGLFKLGEAGVRELCGRLKEEPLDGKVCATLFALQHEACRPGAEKMRATMENVYGEILRSDASVDVKGHLLTELRTFGRSDSVAPVSRLLSVDELCGSAAQTLVSIGTKDASTALLKALPGMDGEGRVSVINALGRMKNAAVVERIRRDLESENPEIVYATVFALANSGDPAAEDALRAAASSKSDRKRRHAIHNLIRYAGRLKEEGHAREAATLCRWLIGEHGKDSHVHCAGLAMLAETEGGKAAGEIIEAMASADAVVREAARKLLAGLPSGSLDLNGDAIDSMLKDAAPVKHAAILKFLGQSGDRAGLAAARRGLDSEDADVRAAAITALGRIGGETDIAALIKILEESERESRDYDLAESALGFIPGRNSTAAIVSAVLDEKPESQVSLLKVLSRRDAKAHVNTLLSIAATSKDEAVRLAVIAAVRTMATGEHIPALVDLLCKASTEREGRSIERAVVFVWRQVGDAAVVIEPITAKLQGAPVNARLGMLRIMGAVGGTAALAMLGEATGSDNAETRTTALTTLSQWKDTSAIEPLRVVSRAPKNEKEGILALRGYIGLAVKLRPAEKAAEALTHAMECAKRLDEKRMIIGRLSSLDPAVALDAMVPYLANEELEKEVSLACCKTISELRAEDIAQRKQLLEKLAKSNDNELARAAAVKLGIADSKKYVFVNFQPAGSETPEGCFADTGLEFGARGNGHTYGWDTKNDNARDREYVEDPRHGTLNHLQKSGSRSWEMRVPNGAYKLHIVCGDTAFSNQVNALEVEGKVQHDPDGQDPIDVYDLQVEVTDGRLTLTPGPGATNCKICYVEIYDLGAN